MIEPVVGDDFEQTNGVGAQVGDCVVGQRTLVGQGPGRPAALAAGWASVIGQKVPGRCARSTPG